jgi:hypothetical protein
MKQKGVSLGATPPMGETLVSLQMTGFPSFYTPPTPCETSYLTHERIAGANKSQTVDKGWGRRGNLGFPTDDQIFRNGMTENNTNTIIA